MSDNEDHEEQRRKMAELESEQAELVRDIEELRVRKRNLCARVEEERRQLEDLKQESQDAKENASSNGQSQDHGLEEKKREMARMESERDAMVQDLKILRERRRKIADRIEEEKQQLEDVQKSVQSETTRKEGLAKDIAAGEDKFQKLGEDIENLENDRERKERSVIGLAKKLEDINNGISRLERRDGNGEEATASYFNYPNGKGYCFVIYYDQNRDGNAKDVEKIRDLCLALEMEHDFCGNEKAEIVRKRFKAVTAKFNDQNNVYDFLLIFILAHGDTDSSGKEVFCTTTSNICIKDELLSQLSKENCPGLANKAALAFIQSCRGDNVNCKEEDQSKKGTAQTDSLPTLLPNVADMLVWKATVERTVAVRTPENGCWFVQAVCNKIMEYPKQRLSKTIHSVTFDASREVIGLEDGRNTFPIPCVSHSTLRADFYFK